MNRTLLNILILLSFAVNSLAVENNRIHRFDYFGTEDGLSQNNVNCIFCDSRGFLWLGTNNGLDRYDGKEFKHYLQLQGASSRIVNVWEDMSGYIWSETYDGHYEYIDVRYDSYGILPDETTDDVDVCATSFIEYTEGLILVGTEKSGLYCLKMEKEGYVVEKINVNGINSFFVDSRDNLWAETTAGLWKWGKEQILQQNWGVCDNYFRNMNFNGSVIETTGRILFVTENHGIQVYNLNSATFDANALSCGIGDQEIKVLAQLPYERIFLATKSGENYYLDGENLGIHQINSLNKKVIDKVYVDRYNQLWVTTCGLGVTRVDLRDWTTKYYQLTPDYLSTSVDVGREYFYEDRNDNLFIATHGSGLLLYDRMNDSFEAYRNSPSDPTSLPSNIVHCVAEDHSGQLWLGTEQYRGGLVKVIMDERAFRLTTPAKDSFSPSDNIVRTTYEDPFHQLWVATRGGKIYIYDDLNRQVKQISYFDCDNGERKSGVAYHIMTDSDGYLWIMTKGAGIFVSTHPIVSKNLDNLRFHNINAENGLGDNNIYRAAEDDYGNIWVTSYGSGVRRIRREKDGDRVSYKVTIFNRKNSNLLSDKARFLMIDTNKDLWVSTTNGVSRLDVKQLNKSQVKFESFVHNDSDNSLSYNDVCYIFEDHEGTKYFATMGGGLNSLKFNKSEPIFHAYTTDDGLCNNIVHSITEDNENNIWIATENGISRLDRDRKAFVSYNINNGLSFNCFSEATCEKLSSGKIIFGGYQGFLTVHPEELRSSLYKGRLILTSFKIATKEVEIGEDSPLQQAIEFTNHIDLSSSQSNITIGFRLLDFLDPENIHYAYMLEGFEDNWNINGSNDYATYTNLPAGDYVFHVKCCYRNGNWSEETTDLKITVHAPFWRTPIAFVIYALLIGLLVLMISRFNTSLKRYEIELTSEKRLTDSKLQFFTNIAHEIRTPLTLIVAPLDDMISKDNLPTDIQAKLRLVERNANRILRLMNRLLDFRKIENKRMRLQVAEVDMGDFITQVGDNFRTVMNLKKINYSIDIQPNIEKIWVDPIEMDTVIYNLLSNAVKFTEPGKHVSLKLEQNSKYTYIIVSDEGCGIKDVRPDVLFKRFTILSSNNVGTGIGLSLSHEIVVMHDGEILVESTLGKGTTFTVKLKNGRAHLEDNEMITFYDISEITTSLFPKETDEDDFLSSDNNDTSKTVLIVEDSIDILNYLCQAMSDKYNCLKAMNGQEALEVIRENTPDLVITDIMMPIMDGEELIKTLKSNFSTSHIPIIALTAKTSIQDQAHIYALGVDGYIGKPFSLEQIRALVKNLMRRREIMLNEIIDPSDNHVSDNEDVNDVRIKINIEPKDKEFVKNLVAYVEENFQEDFSIDQIASEFAMSRTVFFSKVKSLTNQSPLDFIRQIKFHIAEDMLKKGFSVAEVAFKIGYTDTKYFSKQFKQHFGISPSQVKKDDVTETE